MYAPIRRSSSSESSDGSEDDAEESAGSDAGSEDREDGSHAGSGSGARAGADEESSSEDDKDASPREEDGRTRSSLRTQPLVQRCGQFYQLLPQRNAEDDLAHLLSYRERFGAAPSAVSESR